MGHLDKDSKNYHYTNGATVFTTKDIDGETCDILDTQGKKNGNIYDSYKGVACDLHCMESKMDTKSTRK